MNALGESEAVKKLWALLAVVLVIIPIVCGAPVNPLTNLHTLTWETYWVESGHVELQEAVLSLSPELMHQSQEIVRSKRHKRLIYGEDDRIRIDPAVSWRVFPYSAVMRVSTGCSGIMVSPRHVLTAAHCVHDGQEYRESALFLLRAGYVTEDGSTKWSFVRRFFIPTQWKDLDNSNQHVLTNWDDYDIAILEMVSDMSDERDHIPPGLSGRFCNSKKSLNGDGSKVEFVSFPDDKSRDALWQVKTQVESESSNLIYFHGDAWHGCSGAGLYMWDYNDDTGKYERRVIGVLSGNRNADAAATHQGSYNVAARLNPVNFMLVCHWIGTEDQCKERYRQYLNDAYLTSLCNRL